MTGKPNYYEVKVTVEEYYYVQARSELQAFMADLENPSKIVVRPRKIKKVKELPVKP